MAAAQCKPFEITLKSDIATIFNDVVEQAKKNKLVIKGDATKGTIQHTKYKVSGKYTVKGKTITFEMTEDEYFDQCPTIEEEFRKALKGL
jgi:hypothetical protein